MYHALLKLMFNAFAKYIDLSQPAQSETFYLPSVNFSLKDQSNPKKDFTPPASVRNEQFLLFPQCFLLNQKIISQVVRIFYIISLFVAELEEPKIGMWGKGLNNLTHRLRRQINGNK